MSSPTGRGRGHREREGCPVGSLAQPEAAVRDDCVPGPFEGFNYSPLPRVDPEVVPRKPLKMLPQTLPLPSEGDPPSSLEVLGPFER